MKQQNPYLAAAHRSGEPEINAARSNRFFAQKAALNTDLKKYRLHYNETPVGMVTVAHPMEIISWNQNARAFASHQATIGREHLPILEWKEVGQEADGYVYRIQYRENSQAKEILVSAVSKAAARREFNQLANVCAVIKTIELDDDVEGAVIAARQMNSDTTTIDAA
jgi:hypothetical protein